jgi:4-hydroxy-tetrahydrodipicolinate synthase
VNQEANRAYSGIMAPMVTPFTEDEELDEGALRRHTNFLIEAGVHMLFPVCTTGEAWALTREERARVCEIVVEEARGRVPVLAGTGALTTRTTVDLTRAAQDRGVDGVIVITPYYLMAPTEEEFYRHYVTVASATSLPVFPYNHPIQSGLSMSPDLVARLAEVDNIVGMKDGRDLALTIEFIRRTPPSFVVWQGPDNLTFPGLVVGCAGAIPAVANLAPALCVELYQAFRSGDWQRAMRAQEKVSLLRNALLLGTFPAALKEAMRMVGMPVGPARRPAGALSTESRHRLQQVLEAVGVL